MGSDVALVEGVTQTPLPTIVVGDRPSIGGEVVGRSANELDARLGPVWALEPVGRDGDPKPDPDVPTADPVRRARLTGRC